MGQPPSSTEPSVPELNTASSSYSAHANNPRRRRQATACTSCRNRRVRCDRTRPACLQCSKRHQVCEYIGTPQSGIQFVTEPLSSNDLVVPSETWTSVFESQTSFIDGAEPTTYIGLAENKALKHSENVPTFLNPGVDIGSLGDPFSSTLFSSITLKDTYMEYFENYLLTVYPLLPLYPITTLREIYTAFWRNLSPNTSAELLVLILAILYAGAANMNFPNTDSAFIQDMYDKVIGALDLSTYHVISSTNSLCLLYGIIIMNTFRASHLSPFTSFGFLPFAIRFAQSLRLNISQEADSSVDTESHKRLWWHLVFMDTESTIASGLQGIIRPQKMQPPAIDNALTGSGKASPAPMAIAMQGHWEFVHRMQIWLERKPEQHEIIHFGRIIEHLLDILPNGDGSEWTSLYLRMLVDRAYCMLGLRFWQLEQFKGTGCHSEVVRTARSFLQKFLRLAELSQEIGFSWFLPGLIQPIHALMILLMHLHDCAQVGEESKLSRDLIDQVISLRVTRIPNGLTVHVTSNDNPKVIQLNNSRYRVLSIMKMRVWEKFRWPVVIEHHSKDRQVVGSSKVSQVNEMAFEQADLGIRADINHFDQTIWNDWPSSNMPSETWSLDDWDSLMPNFFADKSPQ